MSRRTSATSPARAASDEAPVYRKPRADLYTFMLFVAWSALCVATVFLYLETMEYGKPPFQGAPQVTFSAPPPPAPVDEPPPVLPAPPVQPAPVQPAPVQPAPVQPAP